LQTLCGEEPHNPQTKLNCCEPDLGRVVPVVAAFEAATLDTVSAAGLVEDGLAVAPAAEVRGVDVFGATLKHRRSGSIR